MYEYLDLTFHQQTQELPIDPKQNRFKVPMAEVLPTLFPKK